MSKFSFWSQRGSEQTVTSELVTILHSSSLPWNRPACTTSCRANTHKQTHTQWWLGEGTAFGLESEELSSASPTSMNNIVCRRCAVFTRWFGFLCHYESGGLHIHTMGFDSSVKNKSTIKSYIYISQPSGACALLNGDVSFSIRNLQDNCPLERKGSANTDNYKLIILLHYWMISILVAPLNKCYRAKRQRLPKRVTLARLVFTS